MKEAVLNKIISVIILISLIAVAFFIGKTFIYRSDYFRLKAAETKSAFFDQNTARRISNQILDLYRGRNIFKINLKNIAFSLQAAYPDAREVIARIALPDKITVTLKFRKPLALVRDGKLYPIDEEGFVLPSMDAGSLKGLPVIDGVDIRYDERKGKRNTSANLKKALELLKEMKESGFWADYGADEIDAGDIKKLSFRLKNGLKVIIGSDNFRDRLKLLENTLKDRRLVIERIEYIDVRFEDAVIGPK